MLLKVETALVNASTCQDLMSSINLVGSRLVDVAAGMDNKILSAMSKKGARGSGDSSNSPLPYRKPMLALLKLLLLLCPLLHLETMAGRRFAIRVLMSEFNLEIDPLLFCLGIRVTI